MLKASQRFSALHRGLLLLLVLCSASTVVPGQTSGNPFEIKPRLGQMPESSGPAAADQPTGNPFDIIAPVKDDSAPQGREAWPGAPAGPDVLRPPEPLEGFILGLVLFSFILVSVLVTLFRPYFGKVFRAIANDNMLSLAHREFQQGYRLPFLVLYMTFMVNAGIFLFLVFRRVYEVQWGYRHWTLLLLCISAIGLVFLFKHLLLFFVAGVFPVRKEVSLYSFTIMIFSIFIGIGLFVGNVAMALGSEDLLYPAMLGVAAFIGLVYLVRSLRALLIGSRFIPLHIFHFLLYICTAEIAPVAVGVKLISNQF